MAVKKELFLILIQLQRFLGGGGVHNVQNRTSVNVNPKLT
jgi:hypothetical protein